MEGGTLIEGTKATIAEVGGGRFFGLLLMTGVSHYLYNECAFIALSSVHPVTHAVANTIKRVAVIVVSVLWFRNPLTLLGATGSTIAIIGVLLYSLAKAQAAQQAALKSASKRDVSNTRGNRTQIPTTRRTSATAVRLFIEGGVAGVRRLENAPVHVDAPRGV